MMTVQVFARQLLHPRGHLNGVPGSPGLGAVKDQGSGPPTPSA